MESWLPSWRPGTNVFCDFSSPCLWSVAPAMTKWCQVIQSAAPVAQNHLPETEDLMLQNATPLRKSAPWPPNISDEHVSCTAPATEKNVPRLPSFLQLLQNPHVLLAFDKVHNPLRLPRKTTSERPKVLRTCQLLTLFDFEMCFVPQRRALFVVRAWCVLYILTWTCASSHNGVHFFDITTSKSVPTPVCFVHFDLEMCFAPHFFRHLNFQKCSDSPTLVCFVHFDLQMCFMPQRRAIFHLSSGQLAPHPPL